MLVINYNGNKPTTDYYKYSVQGNNLADTIRFSVSLNQNGLVFDNTYHIYAKVQSVDDDFYDKVELSDIEFDDSENLLKADFHLETKHTSHKQIEISLCCENLQSEVIWQTQLVKVAIANAVNADEEIANTYPTILEQLQAQIDELARKEGGGGSELEIKKIYLTYDDGASIVANYLGTEDGQLGNFINDSTRIWVNFETTPISSAIKSEIRKGRLVIRLDYPIIGSKGYTTTNSSVIKHQPNWDKGYGYKSYTRSFVASEGNELGERKLALLESSQIWINLSDVKTNRYGEEYIHKKISFFDYIRRVCSCTRELSPLTIDEINNTSEGYHLFIDYLRDVFSLGIPSLITHNDEYDPYNSGVPFRGQAKLKLFSKDGSLSSMNQKITANTKKLNPAFSCYSPLKINGWNKSADMIYSPYFPTKKKNRQFSAITSDLVMVNREFDYEKPLIRKHSYMVAKPRLAILNDNFETSEYAYLKLFPQAQQNIRVYCKVIKTIEDHGYSYLPIFRMLITQK